MKIKLADHARASLMALAVITLISFAGNVVFAQVPVAQTETPEVKQLKERLKQLEQAVEELKGKLTTIEETQNTAKTVNAAAENKPVQVIDAVAKDDAILKPSAPANKQDDKKTGGTFEVYGFAMLDAGYQFGQNHPDWFDVLRATKLPSYKDEFLPSGNTFMGVRQSRFGVKSSTPTEWGELKTQFEFELFGTGADAGQTTFRLRHAYGELGQFGGGQTWSPFMDADVFPNSLEYWGPTGMVFFRNVQARWMPLKGRSKITIALERPGASGDQGTYADRIELQGIKPKFSWPDLSWEARYGRDWGYVEIAGIFRSLRWVDTNDDGLDLGGSDLGWGLNLSSNLNFTKNDVGRFQVVYGEGIQNYMNDSPVDVGIKNTYENPNRPIKGVALPVLGVVAFLDHNWNTKFSSSVGYSMQNITNSSGQANDAFHRGHYALGNLLYYPWKNVTVGGEFQWGRRENYRDGFTSNDYRIQFALKYNFSKIWEF